MATEGVDALSPEVKAEALQQVWRRFPRGQRKFFNHLNNGFSQLARTLIAKTFDEKNRQQHGLEAREHHLLRNPSPVLGQLTLVMKPSV